MSLNKRIKTLLIKPILSDKEVEELKRRLKETNKLLAVSYPQKKSYLHINLENNGSLEGFECLLNAALEKEVLDDLLNSNQKDNLRFHEYVKENLDKPSIFEKVPYFISVIDKASDTVKFHLKYFLRDLMIEDQKSYLTRLAFSNPVFYLKMINKKLNTGTANYKNLADFILSNKSEEKHLESFLANMNTILNLYESLKQNKEEDEKETTSGKEPIEEERLTPEQEDIAFSQTEYYKQLEKDLEIELKELEKLFKKKHFLNARKSYYTYFLIELAKHKKLKAYINEVFALYQRMEKLNLLDTKIRSLMPDLIENIDRRNHPFDIEGFTQSTLEHLKSSTDCGKESETKSMLEKFFHNDNTTDRFLVAVLLSDLEYFKYLTSRLERNKRESLIKEACAYVAKNMEAKLLGDYLLVFKATDSDLIISGLSYVNHYLDNVFAYTFEGKSSQEIADILFILMNTINEYHADRPNKNIDLFSFTRSGPRLTNVFRYIFKNYIALLDKKTQQGNKLNEYGLNLFKNCEMALLFFYRDYPDLMELREFTLTRNQNELSVLDNIGALKQNRLLLWRMLKADVLDENILKVNRKDIIAIALKNLDETSKEKDFDKSHVQTSHIFQTALPHIDNRDDLLKLLNLLIKQGVNVFAYYTDLEGSFKKYNITVDDFFNPSSYEVASNCLIPRDGNVCLTLLEKFKDFHAFCLQMLEYMMTNVDAPNTNFKTDLMEQIDAYMEASEPKIQKQLNDLKETPRFIAVALYRYMLGTVNKTPTPFSDKYPSKTLQQIDNLITQLEKTEYTIAAINYDEDIANKILLMIVENKKLHQFFERVSKLINKIFPFGLELKEEVKQAIDNPNNEAGELKKFIEAESGILGSLSLG